MGASSAGACIMFFLNCGVGRFQEKTSYYPFPEKSGQSECAFAFSSWKIILVRYFNPVGAHPSGHIGEDPRAIPNNLMPFIQEVAVWRRPALPVYETDYKTKDGTGVRDYIHVVDLADGHTVTLQKLFQGSKIVYNLGTGKGTSVLEMVAAFEKASGKKIPVIKAGRRPSDAEIVYASTAKAERDLKWNGTKYGIDEMCWDQLNWASKNHGDMDHLRKQ